MPKRSSISSPRRKVLNADDPFDLESGVKKDEVDYAGSKLMVSIGGMRLCPVQYTSMEVGGVAMEVTIAEGESPTAAYARVRKHLKKIQDDEYTTALDEFMDRVEDSANTARARRRR